MRDCTRKAKTRIAAIARRHGGRISRLATRAELCSTPENYRPAEFPFMNDQSSRADGARVLADLHALRAIGAYKTGVHKPTFSEPHIASLPGWCSAFPRPASRARSTASATSSAPARKAGPKLLAGSHLESQNHAGWLDGPLGVVYALEAARVINPRSEHQTARSKWRHGATRKAHFGQLPRQPLLCRRRHRSRYRRRARPQQRQDHARGAARRRPRRPRPRTVRTRPACRLPRSPYRTGRDARKQRPQDRRRHAPSSGSGNTASRSPANRTTPAPRGWRSARTPASRSPDFASLSTSASPAACGPRTVWTTGRITLDPGAPSIIPGSCGNAVPDSRRRPGA